MSNQNLLPLLKQPQQQPKQPKLNELSDKLLTNIVIYLDPKSIGNLVLISSQMRINVGKIIKPALLVQQKYGKNLVESSFLVQKYLEYKELLKDCHLFKDASQYEEFVNLMTFKNKFYFINFFSFVFNMPVKITQENLLTQRENFKKMNEEVFVSLFQLQFTHLVPKLQNQLNYLKCNSEKVLPIVNFVNKLLQKARELQFLDNPLEAFISFQKGKENCYVQQFTKLMYVNLSKQYTETIYYLPFSRSYFEMLSFNINSVIFQFLTIQDLQKLRAVNKMFNDLVKRITRIICNDIVIKNEEIEKNLKEEAAIGKAVELTKKNSQLFLTQYRFSLSENPIIPSGEIKQLINIFLRVVQYPLSDLPLSYIISSLDLYNILYTRSEFTFNLNIHEESYYQLDNFISSGALQSLKTQNTVINKICLFLEILHHITKYQIKPIQVKNYIDKLNKVTRYFKFAKLMLLYSKRINSRA